jgi:hypothetical protein
MSSAKKVQGHDDTGSRQNGQQALPIALDWSDWQANAFNIFRSHIEGT